MTSLYKKINIDVSDIVTVDNLIGELRFRLDDSFCEYNTSSSIDQLVQLFSPKIKFSIKPSKTTLTEISSPGIAIHTDDWPISLNYYLSIAAGKTYFYKVKPGSTEQIARSKLYNLQDLELVDTFTPNQFDLYLFNTSIPHSVDIPKNNEKRYIFRFMWYDYDFDEIASSINVVI